MKVSTEFRVTLSWESLTITKKASESLGCAFDNLTGLKELKLSPESTNGNGFSDPLHFSLGPYKAAL